MHDLTAFSCCCTLPASIERTCSTVFLLRASNLLKLDFCKHKQCTRQTRSARKPSTLVLSSREREPRGCVCHSIIVWSLFSVSMKACLADRRRSQYALQFLLFCFAPYFLREFLFFFLKIIYHSVHGDDDFYRGDAWCECWVHSKKRSRNSVEL